MVIQWLTNEFYKWLSYVSCHSMVMQWLMVEGMSFYEGLVVIQWSFNG